MTLARTIIAIVLLVLAAYIAVMNLGCIIFSLRNQKRGIDKHHSQVFIFHNILPLTAFFIYPHCPKWWIWLIPGLDPSNWTLLAWPFLILKEKRKDTTTASTATNEPADGGSI
ncbi:MAG: hypothetical protein EOM12_17070 [Verrucomicrobiae bacterium]|nr:hypothetical protein [Verrucomicrobiae bacterium]